MSFHTVRKQVLDRLLAKLAERFITSDDLHEFDPTRRTVVLLPGGMGSELAATALPFDQLDPSKPFVPPPAKRWGDLGPLCRGSAIDLEMTDQGEDLGGRVVFAESEILMQPLVTYRGVRDFFERRPNKEKFNFAVFPFDWRRDLVESAELLDRFLSALREAVNTRGGMGGLGGLGPRDPMDGVTLLAHSMGGLVGKLYLNRIADGQATSATRASWNGRLITVGAPFYGTDTIIRHFFLPMPELAELAPYQPASRLPRVVATMPGPYVLFFADREILTPDTLEDLGLDRDSYPLRDFDAPDQAVDPYDPANRWRFPAWITAPQPGWSRACDRFIDEAAAVRREIVRPLDGPDEAALRESIFHLRGVRNRSTGVGVRWRNPGPDGFIPDLTDEAEPFTPDPDLPRPPDPRSGKLLYGDGLVPFWSARLSWVDAESQVYDLRQAQDHMALLASRETLEVVGSLLDRGALPGTATGAPRPAAAGGAAAAAFAGPASGRAGRRGLPSAREAAAERSLRRDGVSGLTAAELAMASPELGAKLLAENGLG